MIHKKRYIKKWLEKMLISINCFIFCLVACIDDFTSIKAYLLLILCCGLVFGFNALIINKYGRILKDNE